MRFCVAGQENGAVLGRQGRRVGGQRLQLVLLVRLMATTAVRVEPVVANAAVGDGEYPD